MTTGRAPLGQQAAGVNSGYQRDDRAIIDYGLWPLADQQARGPVVDPDQPFGVTLGAAQVFGRFVERPFPALVAERLGLPMLNLGFSGSGPSFFLQRPELIALANRARLAVVHLSSGRSVANSRVALAGNQGVGCRRDASEPEMMYAERVYSDLLRTLPADRLAALRAEIRATYVDEMRRLLALLAVPKVLLWWSKRPPEYPEKLDTLVGYWGDFPHFVNRDVVDQLRWRADAYVEVVTDRGSPQPLRDRETGQDVLMWPEETFPNIRHRHHNVYYPSPEMNEDAAEALVPACAALLSEGAPAYARPEPPRAVLVHYDLFLNAGWAIRRSLGESFGGELLGPEQVDGAKLAEALERRPDAQAVSAPQLRLAEPPPPRITLHPIVLLRHPLLRARAVYDYERGEERQARSDAFHTRMAATMSFAEWIGWCLSDPPRAGPVANYQTRRCASKRTGHDPADWGAPVDLGGLLEARTNLSRALVGTVEALRPALVRFETALRLDFPRLRLLARADDEVLAPGATLDQAVASVRDELGDKLFAQLSAANAWDLHLHELATAGMLGR